MSELQQACKALANRIEAQKYYSQSKPVLVHKSKTMYIVNRTRVAK